MTDARLASSRILQNKPSPEAVAKFKQELPHIYGYKDFWWSREFWDSTNRYTFLTMSNQSGKSIVSIRKSIRLATDPELWKRAFRKETLVNGKPGYGFYFYPSLGIATREFENKWVTQVLPRGDMKNDPKYGWEEEYKDGEIYCIHYKIGTKTYFMSYNMKVQDLQAASPHWVGADEEMPERLWGEISARLLATKGLFSLVCTPTLGEEFWRRVFELNKMPDAKVIKATMYDTIKFLDGSPGLRTKEEIEEYKAKLPTQRDIDIRVYGKFAKADGLVYPMFDAERLIVEPDTDAHKWPVYCGIDVGSGGHAHPAAIIFIAVRDDYREARLIKAWRGNRSETTTSVDILRRYQEMKVGLNIVATYYDYQSREFGLQALADGEPVLQAEKSHDLGEAMLNMLFKHGMLLLEKCQEVEDLAVELQNLKRGAKKQDAKDDLIDALRYACVKIPFDTSHIGVRTVVKKAEKARFDVTDRRSQLTTTLQESKEFADLIEERINFWNEFT